MPPEIEAKGRRRSVNSVWACVTFLRVALVLSVVFSFYILLVGIHNPIMDMYSFRQTQTALTSYWILQGGPWISYETPVLGAPWAIPFEFPVYQLLVAGLSSLGVGLDESGRVINFIFFIAVIAPIWWICRVLKLGAATFCAVSILYVLSPLYMYWSRTFLIESCALFFAVLWLAFALTCLMRGGWGAAVGAVIAGCLAVLAKATTFPAFVLVASLGGAWVFVARLREGEAFSRLFVHAFVLSLCVIVPLLAGWVWVGYSDDVKLANPFGAHLTSAALSAWNFGTLQQKLSSTLWSDIVIARIVPNLLGAFHWLAVAAILLCISSRRSLFLVVISLIGFLTPILLFTNLHMVHTYYQVANGVFLLVAVGIAVGALFDRGYPSIATVVLVAICAGQVTFFQKNYLSVITNDHAQDPVLRIALLAKAQTQPEQSLVVIGEDWSSAVAYYSERKTLTLPGWAKQGLIERVFADPQAFLGDRPLGGIVFCANRVNDYGSSAPLAQGFVADRAVLGQFGECQLLAPQRSS